MSFQNLAPCLSQVETALKQCLSALSAEHPVSVSALSETIGHCANALKTCTTALLVSLLATCQPSYAITKCDFASGRNHGNKPPLRTSA